MTPRSANRLALAAFLCATTTAMLVACHAPAQRPKAPATTAIATTAGHGWLQDVTAISANTDNTGRRAALEALLAGSGLDADAVAFTAKEHRGTNLLARVSGSSGQPLLLLGAHYDKVDVGNGVTDNAAGSAVVLALAHRFQQRPLRNHRVAAAFWDLEEKGLLGAHAYVTDGGEKPALYVNFDVFGWGDTLWMMAPDRTNPLVAASAEATQAKGIGLVSGNEYPPTDHLAFLKAGWPAVSYSLVDRGEIGPILKVFKREKVEDLPKVMRVIHSTDDTIEQVDAGQVETAIDAVETALRTWDAGHDG